MCQHAHVHFRRNIALRYILSTTFCVGSNIGPNVQSEEGNDDLGVCRTLADCS
jgi:hypothetical protein